jgi:ATP phosphoribosyltransferase
VQPKLALPKGHLLRSTEALLRKAGLELSDYNEQSRSYRPKCSGLSNLLIKVFHEKDIPIQVAVGNYDLGICGLDWIEELLVRYPSSALIKVQNLGYGKRDLCIAQGKLGRISSLEELKSRDQTIRIVSEYPGLAESFALKCRLKRFKIFPVWGAAEVYPPESAELALISQSPANGFPDHELDSLATILESSAFLVANRDSWESKDLTALLQPLYAVRDIAEEYPTSKELEAEGGGLSFGWQTLTPDLVRLALPDGHQQQPTAQFLSEAGIKIWGYSPQDRRLTIAVGGVAAKVIRPQDMPLQVANENFDLAITGKDWLYDHLYRFPSSPVREILDLGFGKVRIVAVVSQELGVNSAQDLRGQLRGRAIRVASEYVNIADKYARDNHFSPYQVIPTWGASEAFLPEDADVLIENTQTGRTLVQHNLKIIDTLFESSACLIGNINSCADPIKERRIASKIEMLQKAKVEGDHAC